MMICSGQNQTGPLVSIVIPAYNAARYIDETIQSVLRQTYPNWEVIVVDDCSTDDTRSILRHYCDMDTRIHMIAQEKNAGVAEARNRGLEAAQGSWVALLDSDDIWMENKLESQLALAEKTGANLVYCSYLLLGQKEKAFLVPDRVDFETMLYKSVMSCSTVMMSREIAQRYRFNGRFYHEDLVFWLDILKDGWKARGCTEVLAAYRLSAGSRSFDKLSSARHRWEIYRNHLGLSVMQSVVNLLRYATAGIRKYLRVWSC